MYEICMQYKCKVCPKKLECDKKLERLRYKPFEDLPKILEEKRIKIW